MLLLVLLVLYYGFIFFIVRQKLLLSPPFKRILLMILMILPFGDTFVGYLTYNLLSYDNKGVKIYQTITNAEEQTAYGFKESNLPNIVKTPYSPYVYTTQTTELPLLGISSFKQTVSNTTTNQTLGENEETTFTGGWIFKFINPAQNGEKRGSPLEKEAFVKKIIPNPMHLIDKTFIRYEGGFLALDRNHDGFIDTSSLKESKVFFDLKKDGMKKKVGWIKSTDALLVFDKNGDGKIDATNETLGNAHKDGFEEARVLIDSNLDGKVDENDILFDRLKLWFDYDQNGIATLNELQSMKDAEIDTINLNYIQTTMMVGEHNISKVSEYSDNHAKKELIAQIHLAYDPRITSLNFQALENFKLDIHTIRLPLLRGYGLIKDSFIVYNLNPSLQELTKSYAQNITLIQNSFDKFIDEWSEYNAYKAKVAQKYNLKANIEMADVDRKIWIMERFSGMTNLTAPIEAYYESKAKAITDDKDVTLLSADANSFLSSRDYINHHYAIMKNRNEGMFALQSVFKKLLIGTHYKVSTDTFEISNLTALNEQLIYYFNNPSIELNEKQYLIKIIQNLSKDKIILIHLDDILPKIENQTLLNILNQH